jgi:EmrB/QacA subfamily drug resistance transporter
MLGAVICALAPSIEVLIVGRVLSGVAGGVFPLAFGIINDELPGDRRATAIGLMSAMFGIGGGIGMPLSGVIIDNSHVSVIFWLGLMAVPAAIAVFRYVPASPARRRTKIDVAGAAVLSTGLAAILLAISRANSWGWTSPEFLALLLAGVGTLAFFVRLELRTPEPLVDMRVMRHRPVLATNVTGFLVGIAMFASFICIPQFAQTPEASGYGFGMTTTQAGLLMLPSAVAMLIAGPFGGSLGNRIGFRATLMIGTVLSGLSFALLAVAHSSTWDFIAAGVLMGFGISFAFASMANLIVASVDPREVGIATGINTVTRTVGGAFGSALVAALLAAETIPSTPFPTEGAYTEAFALSSIVALFALAAAMAIPRLKKPAAAPAAQPRGGQQQPAGARA